MMGKLSTVASPLFAGILVDRFGFPTMFAVSMSLILFSVVPLFLMPRHQRHRESYSFKAVVGLLKREPRFAGSVYWWHVADAVQAYFWPVYLFLIIRNYTVFGAVGSLVLVLSSLMVYLAGRVYDQRPLHRVFPATAGMMLLTWLLRFLTVTPVAAATADGISRFLSPLWWMKVRRQELLVGERNDSLTFGAAHELLVSAGLLVGLVTGYALLAVTNVTWIWLMVPAGVGIVSATWLLKDS
jgi:hypothetical protein